MLEPSTDGRRMLAGWSPPSPFPPLVVHYWDPARPPDLLWVMLNGVDRHGRRAYVAVGPAGKPAYGMRSVSDPGVPEGTRMEICITHDEKGHLVYDQLPFTLN